MKKLLVLLVLLGIIVFTSCSEKYQFAVVSKDGKDTTYVIGDGMTVKGESIIIWTSNNSSKRKIFSLNHYREAFKVGYNPEKVKK